MHTGSCLCGGIQFRIESELAAVQICHCAQCRKAQGGPFATNIPVARDAFQFANGEQLLKGYESSPGKYRHFCGTCGSPIFSWRESAPNVLRIRAGLINEPLRSGLESHAFVASKCNWWPISDELPQHEGSRP